MIKITTELKQNAGFTSKVSVLEITSYTVNETVSLVSGGTMPLAPTGKNLQIQFSLYKSASDKAAGATSYQAVDFPYSFSFQPTVEDVIDSAYLYNKVSEKLTELNYTNELI